jgi:hypothetical protein
MAKENPRKQPYLNSSGILIGYTCSVHDWSFETDDYCPVCKGEEDAEKRILKLFNIGKPAEAIICDYWSDEDYDKDDALKALKKAIKESRKP